MPRRRERILGFDRLNGIEIADLADRLMETWPATSADLDGIAQAREHVEALERNVAQLGRIVVDLKAELARLAGDEPSGGDRVDVDM